MKKILLLLITAIILLTTQAKIQAAAAAQENHSFLVIPHQIGSDSQMNFKKLMHRNQENQDAFLAFLKTTAPDYVFDFNFIRATTNIPLYDRHFSSYYSPEPPFYQQMIYYRNLKDPKFSEILNPEMPANDWFFEWQFLIEMLAEALKKDDLKTVTAIIPKFISENDSLVKGRPPITIFDIVKQQKKANPMVYDYLKHLRDPINDEIIGAVKDYQTGTAHVNTIRNDAKIGKGTIPTLQAMKNAGVTQDQLTEWFRAYKARPANAARDFKGTTLSDAWKLFRED